MVVWREGGCVLESLSATRKLRVDGVAGSLRFICEGPHENVRGWCVKCSDHTYTVDASLTRLDLIQLFS